MELNIAIVDDTLSDVLRLKNFIRNWSYGSVHELGLIQFYVSGEEMLKDFTPKIFLHGFGNITFIDN